MLNEQDLIEKNKELGRYTPQTSVILRYKQVYRNLLNQSTYAMTSLYMSEQVVNDAKSFLTNYEIQINANDELNDAFQEFICESNFFQVVDEYITLYLSFGEAFMYMLKTDGKINFAASSIFSTIPTKMTNNTFDEIYVVSGDAENTYYTKLGRQNGIHESYIKKMPLPEYGRKDTQINQPTSLLTSELIPEQWVTNNQFIYNTTGLKYQDYMSVPYCKSLFWNIDLFKQADIAYNLWRKELKYSEKIIAVDKSQARTMAADTRAFNRVYNKENYPKSPNVDETETITDTDSKLGNVFKVFNVGKDIMKEFATNIRREYMDAIMLDLKLIGQSARFGSDFYQVDNAVRDGASTAFEVRVRVNAQFTKTITKLRNDLMMNLRTLLCSAIVEAALIGQLPPNMIYINYNDLSVRYPEIFEDDISKRDYLTNLYNLGCLSKKTLLVKGYNFTVQDAIQEIFDRNTENAVSSMATVDPTILLNRPVYAAQPQNMPQTPDKGQDDENQQVGTGRPKGAQVGNQNASKNGQNEEGDQSVSGQ